MTGIFEYPWLLALAVVLPVAVVTLMLRGDRARRERVARMGTTDVVRRLLPASVLRSARWRVTRIAVAAALIGVAAAGPRWGYERTIVRSSGIDVVLALDASLSMMATDERPNRMERMKQEVRRLREMSQGDRVGLLAFAGRSYVLSPLTVDGGALDLFLDNLDPTVVGQAGSSLARTIKQGVDLLKLSTSGADRALVVMSDGEAFEEMAEVRAEAERARSEGISVVTVGFGTPGGANIPIIAPDGSQTFKRDEAGQVVVTRYHPEFLETAATAAGGTFIAAEATDKAGQVKRALSALRTQTRNTYTGENRVARFQWFLLPALLLLLLETLLGERRGSVKWEPAAAKVAVAAILMMFLSGCTRFVRNGNAVDAYNQKAYAQSAALFRNAVEVGDRSAETRYNFGTALIGADSLDGGVEILGSVAQEREPEVRYRSLFNLGLAHLRLTMNADSSDDDANREGALAAYRKVLIAHPDDMDAKWNYELALRRQQSGGGGGGQSDAESQADQSPSPAGSLAQRQAEQLLGSAAREERDVQANKQKKNRVEPPPGGKDW
jgi:Ca-activated chloride channel family protein